MGKWEDVSILQTPNTGARPQCNGHFQSSHASGTGAKHNVPFVLFAGGIFPNSHEKRTAHNTHHRELERTGGLSSLPRSHPRPGVCPHRGHYTLELWESLPPPSARPLLSIVVCGPSMPSTGVIVGKWAGPSPHRRPCQCAVTSVGGGCSVQ